MTAELTRHCDLASEKFWRLLRKPMSFCLYSLMVCLLVFASEAHYSNLPLTMKENGQHHPCQRQSYKFRMEEM
jgi:hypothetical protein